MFESIMQFFKKLGKSKPEDNSSKETAKERLHLVLMQDRANVSADFLDLMKQEIIEVIKKYIDVDENAIDVRLANKTNSDGTTGAPALYANIPIVSIKNEERHLDGSVPEKKKKEENENKEQVEKIDENGIEKEKNDDNNQEDNLQNEENEIKEEAKSIEDNKNDVEEKIENQEENKEEQKEEKNSESVEVVTNTNID